MRLWRSILVATFLGWIGLQAFHSHAALTQGDTQCQVCKIAHQTPALLSTPHSLSTTLIVVATHTTIALRPALVAVFTTHGLAPPLL